MKDTGHPCSGTRVEEVSEPLLFSKRPESLFRWSSFSLDSSPSLPRPLSSFIGSRKEAGGAASVGVGICLPYLFLPCLITAEPEARALALLTADGGFGGNFDYNKINTHIFLIFRHKCPFFSVYIASSSPLPPQAESG